MTALNQFWDNLHSQDNGQWLTGSRIQNILDLYRISRDQLENKNVLEIGIGRLFITEWLSQVASTLYACDISLVALEKAKRFTPHVYPTQDIKKIPAVDLALCHLVFVHCTDDECHRMLSNLNLAPGGKLYCQFSCLKTPDAIEHASDHARRALTQDGPHFFRTPTTVESMIEASGLIITNRIELDPGAFLGWHGQYWLCLECQKNKGNLT